MNTARTPLYVNRLPEPFKNVSHPYLRNHRNENLLTFKYVSKVFKIPRFYSIVSVEICNVLFVSVYLLFLLILCVGAFDQFFVRRILLKNIIKNFVKITMNVYHRSPRYYYRPIHVTVVRV